ncbi:CHASE2 domain-containing protein [Aquabacterium sp. OR-4]|uniref:CHASE2 domain-containing protein n=1 Tax=Aquabacterium sp. OR-4 TaxID=2978127 RepID=UPI0028C6E9A3|nr:adenylate/guanylate cyclase domain-containing protein [Aquabacterium sp. OR-4]MDT7836208.1 adenylate/guanylate cyclase domain-containing protein [Aquabacterium sp. OR-4]
MAGLLVLLLGSHALGLLNLPPLQRLDLLLHDSLLAAFAPTEREPRVAIVDIDERALAAHGRWPWRRALLAELVDCITGDQGAHLVALDMVLAEPDAGPDTAALKRLLDGPLRDRPEAAAALHSLLPSLDDDALLAATLARRPVVLGLVLTPQPHGANTGALPPAVMPDRALGPRLYELPVWHGHGANQPLLQQAARGAGHLNGLVDVDGVVRRVPLLVRREGRVLGSLALVTAQHWLGSPVAVNPLPPAAAAAWSPLGGLRLAGPRGTLALRVDRHGEVQVPYRRDGGFKRYSAADVLSGRVPADALRGRIVLVGVGAAGLGDQRLTPLAGTVPGTDVQASLLAGLLNGEVRAQPAWAGPLQAALLPPVAWLLLRGYRHRRLAVGALWTAAVLLASLALLAAAWAGLNAWLPGAALIALPPLLLALHLVRSYQAMHGARRQLAALFGQYVPPELVAQMSREPARYSMSSRSAEITVMFADVRDFTRIAQQLPPAQLSASMNLLLSHLTDIVREHRGTLDKYIGDAVMAFWGAPLDDPDQARHAVAAALAMQARLPVLRAELAPLGWPELGLSIGINTGTVVVGDMGSRHRRAYTVMGDAVNVAARLQALAAREGLGLVIGERTRQALDGRLCLALGTWQVRGRDGAEAAWHPLAWHPGENAVADRLAQRWARLREAVEAGRHDEARAMLDTLQAVDGVDPLLLWQRAALQRLAARRD